MLSFTESENVALIAAAGTALAGLLGIAGLYLQNRRNTNAQRGDHAATASLVREIRTDQLEMKADLRDVKDEVRSHGDRLRNLEHMTAVQDHTDRIVADNGRKLQAIQDHNKEQAS